MKTALITTTLTIVLIATLLAAVAAQRQTDGGPPWPLPPDVHAVFCGNYIVTEREKTALFQTMQDQGCQDIHFVPIPAHHGLWLGYGTRVEFDDL